MSINVTVTGNPVCIKKGKMVTADPKDVHKEFQKRRKIRLEQVRQQSKEIAESVRNKVRKEKSKQLSSTEKECATKLKEWQNNKLLELQNQYRESLKDIGLGHTQARVEEAVETDYIEKRDKYNEDAALSRGQQAQQQQQIIRNEENLKKAMPAQRRRLARDAENARSSKVCNSKKNCGKKNKKKRSLINVSITKDVSDSDSDEVNLVDENGESSESSVIIEGVPEVEAEKLVSPKKKKMMQENSDLKNAEVSSKPMNCADDDRGRECRKESPCKRTHKSSLVTVTTDSSLLDQPFDTRISERIKNRRLIDSHVTPSHPLRISEISETSSEDVMVRANIHKRKETIDVDVHKPANCSKNCGTQTSLNCKGGCNKSECSKGNKFAGPQKAPENVATQTKLSCKESSNSCQCLKENRCNCAKKCPAQQTQTSLDKQSCNLPSMPTISLRSGVSQNNQNKRDYTRVQYYDHDNRFNKDYIIDGADVQKISEDSIEVCVNCDSDTDFQRSCFEREKTARLRGKRALEKEKIQRDYEDLLKKLPVLQKQERIAGLDPERDKFHMSDGRLRDFEKNRQGRIEEAFEKLNPNMITLNPKTSASKQNERSRSKCSDFDKYEKEQKSKCSDFDKYEKEQKSKGCLSKIEEEETKRTRCNKDGESPPFKTVDVEKENNLAWKSVNNLLHHSNSQTSRENLRTLLEKLKAQKEILMQENNTLPENSNLCNLLEDLEKCNKKVSSTITTTSSSSSHNKKQNFKKGSTPKKRKQNLPREVLILQNTSTQTSPNCEKRNTNKKCSSPDITVDAVSENQNRKCFCGDKKGISKAEVDIGKCDKNCNCLEKDNDKICEIFIKIQDNEKPEIIISSPNEKKGVVNIDINEKSEDDKIETNLQTGKSCRKIDKKNLREDKKTVNKKDVPDKRKQKTENSSFWREQLSRNEVTNSSTSYYSPPDYSRDCTNDNICSLLSKKQQQSNVSVQTKSPKLDPELFTYIKRLLEMSKGSIENLCVSSVSEVSTPSSSIIENANNVNPAQKLISLLKNLNVNVDKRTKNLNSNCKRNQTNQTRNQNNTTEDSRLFQSTCRGNEVDSRGNIESLRRNVESPRMNVESPRIHIESPGRIVDSPENVLVKNITEITDKCQEKINKLTEKIESLRAEKNHIISPGNKSNGSDKENVTAYMNLPSMLIQDANYNRSQSLKESSLKCKEFDSCRMKTPEQIVSICDNSSRSNSPEQIALNNKLLQIDLGKSGDVNDLVRTITAGVQRGDYNDEIDGDIIERFVKLLAVPVSVKESTPFVPVLMDIPKLPKLTTNSVQNNEKKPPPSKGLRYNNLDMVPHELSTIPEADSIRRSKSPESPKNKDQDALIQELLRSSRCNKSAGNEDLNALRKVPQIQSPNNFKESSPVQNSRSSKSPSPSSDSNQKTYDVKKANKGIDLNLYENPIAGPSREVHTREATSEELMWIMKQLKDTSTESSTDKSEEFESVLKSLGMDWAVATLKKTQEALARNSSSSSSTTSKLLLSNDSQTISGSNSSLKSNNFLSEHFPDISAIQVSSSEKRKTSTPVNSLKSYEKSRYVKERIFTEESDLSSVRERTKEEWNFISIPEGSADDSTMI